MKTLYLDCFCGISGDMLVGALLDVGADMGAIEAAAAAMHIEGLSVKTDKVMKKGVLASKFHVMTDPRAHQPHRHLPHILEMIQALPIPEPVKTRASAAFELLGNAEAEVHGMPVERVHFHEVGAVDSIVDIVAANLALHSLGVECVLASPLTVGGGTVVCDHGVMPVPAPATALLLRGIPWKAGDVSHELVTPTGAALAKQWTSAFGPAPIMTTCAVGYGAGDRDLPDRANVLRLFLGEIEGAGPRRETVSVLETVIDDMNPELCALLIPTALQAGARDAFVSQIIAKKGRAALRLTVLCDPEKAPAMARLLFEHSSTLGIRVREETRWVLDRETRQVSTPWGTVPVKLGFLDGAVQCAAPEFENCQELARQSAVATRRVYEAALAAALQGDFST